jgi:hypothetical protein
MAKTLRRKVIAVGQVSVFDVNNLGKLSPYIGCPFEFMNKANMIFIVRDYSMAPYLIPGDYIFGIALPKPTDIFWGNVGVVQFIHDFYLVRLIFPVKGREDVIELRSQKSNQFPTIIRPIKEIKRVYRIGPLVRNV